MVHALHEIERVLVPGGILIDLRPVLDRWPVEVSGSSGSQEVGLATDLPSPLNDDLAANEAMAAQLAEGGLLREAEETFPFFYYWDSAKEMQEYIAENWDDVITVEDDVWDRLRSVWATANADARVRLRLKMLITRYRFPLS